VPENLLDPADIVRDAIYQQLEFDQDQQLDHKSGYRRDTGFPVAQIFVLFVETSSTAIKLAHSSRTKYGVGTVLAVE
jgi:hypothetical protein